MAGPTAGAFSLVDSQSTNLKGNKGFQRGGTTMHCNGEDKLQQGKTFIDLH